MPTRSRPPDASSRGPIRGVLGSSSGVKCASEITADASRQNAASCSSMAAFAELVIGGVDDVALVAMNPIRERAAWDGSAAAR